MLVQPIKTRVFQEGDDLLDFVAHYLKKIPDHSIVVITSKIVALAERRVVERTDVQTKERLIKLESELAIPTKYAWLTVKDGQVMASAGIDESNADGKFILLPKDSFKTASDLRKKMMQKYKVKNLGILITDSRTLPLRSGVSGVAVGYAGFKGIKDYRKTPDIFGRKFHYSKTDIADSLATAATLVMGEGREQHPLAHVTNAPVEFCDRVNRRELEISIEDDMYRPLFTRLR